MTFYRIIGRSSFGFCLLFLLLVPNVAFSNEKVIGSSPWRFGAGVAIEYIRADTKLGMKPANNSIISLNSVNVGISSSQYQVAVGGAFSPSLEFGRMLFDNYYLGLFLSWRAPNMKSTAIYNFKSLPYRFSNEFKISSYTNLFLKGGYKPTKKTMIYGLIGPTFLKWSHKTDYVQLDSDNSPLQVLKTSSKRMNSIGFGIGAGIEYKVTKKLVLSADYSCSFYRSTKDSFGISYTETVYVGRKCTRSGTVIKSLQPYHSTFALRLSYFL